MSVFDLDPSAQETLLERATANPIDPNAIHASWYEGIPTGIYAGGARSFAKSTINLAYDAENPDRENETLKRGVEMYQRYTPDPKTVGTAGNLLGSISEMGLDVVQALADLDITPIQMAQRFTRQGEAVSYATHPELDKETRTNVARTEGVIAGLGAVVPMSVAGGLATRMVSGGIGFAGFGAAGRGVVGAELDNAGYHDMAQQYKALDAASIATDLVLGAAFGGLLGHRPTKEVKPSEVDAALTANNANHIELDTAPGIPADVQTRQAHVDAVNAHLDALLRDETPPLPSDEAVNGNFIPNPAAEAARQEIGAAVQEHVGPLDSLRSELEARGLPTDENLYSRGTAVGDGVEKVTQAAREAFGEDTARLMDSGAIQIVERASDLPARSDGQPHPEDAKGYYDGERVYLVGDNVSANEAKGVILHEVGAHVGMEKMLGTELYGKLTQEVADRGAAGEAGFAEALRQVPADTPAGKVKDEALAYLVQNRPELPLVKRIISAVKASLYRLLGGRFVKLSADDIRSLAVAALKRTSSAEAFNSQTDSGMYARGASGLLRRYGESVKSQIDAERRFGNGDLIFGFHELDEKPVRIQNIGDLENYAPDQLMALPASRASGLYARAKVVKELVKEGDKLEQAAPLDKLISSDKIPTISLQDLVGKTIFPTIADRTKAGALFTGIDSAKLQAAVELPGGPFFPLRESNAKSGVVWANRGKSIVTKKGNKVGGGASYMMVLMGDANMHASNRTFATSFMAQLDAYVKGGRISPENMQALEELIKSSPTTDKAVQAHIDRFPGFADPVAFHDYVNSLSFEASKRMTSILGSKAAEEHGAPSMTRLLDATREESLAGNRWGDGALVLKINEDAPMVTLGEEGTATHPDYPYGIKGEVVGKLHVPVNYELLWKDWLNLARENALKRNAESEAPKANFQPNTRRAFELSLPELKITQDLVDQIGPLKQANIDSPRQAQLATDMALDRWSTSDQKVNEGGASPQEFVDAINHSSAKVVLNKYSTAEVKQAIKDGTMRVFNLGGEKDPTGRSKTSGIWFALKRGPADTYGLDIPELTDNEVTLTAVINNEQGARGVGGPAVLLKALQEGATVLDCFAVKSDRFPEGFLPALYKEFGFEPVGEVPFAKEYYSEAKLADAEKFWRETSPGWDPKTHDYPPVVIMKWRGNDADRSQLLGRYLRDGSEAILAGRADRDAEAAAAQFDGNDLASRQEGRTSSDTSGTRGNQTAGNRGSLASRALRTVEGIAGLNDAEAKNLGIKSSDVEAVRAKLEQSRTDAALADKPNMEIQQDDGLLVPARYALEKADAEIAKAEQDSQGFDAAVACALRG